MFDVFKATKPNINTSRATTDKPGSLIFSLTQLCSLATVIACCLVTARKFIGDNINCITDFTGQKHKSIETYCFISSTFTSANLTGVQAHPGVGPILASGEEEHIHHAYYQWVPFVLVLQAVFFYLPRFIWKNIDGSYMRSILNQLHKIHIANPEPRIKQSAKWFVEYLHTHAPYSTAFFLCECLAVGVSVGNLFFTNIFLGGRLFQEGHRALRYLDHDHADPYDSLNIVFPKVAKCTFHVFGASGTIQKLDALCVLPLNIVNEKTYVILWMLYSYTMVIMALTLLAHLLLFIPVIRNSVLIFRCKGKETKAVLKTILPSCNYGDWFFLYHIKNSMVYFRAFVQHVQKEMEEMEGTSKVKVEKEKAKHGEEVKERNKKLLPAESEKKPREKLQILE